MSTIEEIRKKHASRVYNELELALARRTQECLTATCAKRVLFQMKHSRPPTPEECSKECPYHPEHESSPGRSQRRNSYYDW